MQRTKKCQYTIHIFNISKNIPNVPMQIYLLKSFNWLNMSYYQLNFLLFKTTDGCNTDNCVNIGFNFVREC